MKVLIFDSGTIINFAINGLLYIIEELKKDFDGKFIVTEQVKEEIFDKPLKIHRFELEALEIKRLFDLKVLELPSAVDASNSAIKKGTEKFMNIANSSVEANGVKIKIVSEAEISCMALSKELSDRGIKNLISIDERTARVLSERPENLEKLMSRKLNTKVKVNLKELRAFSDFRFIRSSELGYVAHKKGVLRISGPQALEAILYATKYNGASISFEEIDELKKM